MGKGQPSNKNTKKISERLNRATRTINGFAIGLLLQGAGF